MNEQAPLLGHLHDTFLLPPRPDKSLPELVEEADFDQVHFFIKDALRDKAIPLAPKTDRQEFSLIPYSHPAGALNDEIFDELQKQDLQPATFRDLVNLAIERPDLQREYDIISLGTLRTRKIFKDRPGETLWNQTERDRTICQWATGLSCSKSSRTLVPMQLYLEELLSRPTLLLVYAPPK